MPDAKYSLPNDKNAITSFSVVVNFHMALQPPAFGEVIAELQRIKTALNLPAPVQMPQIGINFGGPPQMPISHMPLAMGFQRFSPNGTIAESVVCEPQAITYTTSVYSGWDDVKRTILDSVGSLFSIYVKYTPAISSFLLQYVNSFVCRDGVYASASELFRDKNKWIPEYLNDANDAWHVHIGKYVPGADIDRILLNVNFDFTQPVTEHGAGPFNLNALILCGVFYNIPGKSPLVVDVVNDSALDIFQRNIDLAHDEEKKALSEIFSDTYLRLMGAIK